MASLAQYISANFPTPSAGDSFVWGGVNYTYDANPGIWTGALPQPDALEGAATSSTAPSQPNEGDLWYDGTKLNVRTDNEWVEASPQPTAADLMVAPALSIFDAGAAAITTNTNVMRFTSTTGDAAGVAVTSDGDGQARVAVTFPTVPTVASVPNTGSSIPTAYVTTRNADATLSATPLATALGTIGLNSLRDVSDTAPSNGMILTYSDTDNSWMPAAAPSGGSAVSIDSAGDTLTIGSNSTEIPVISGASVVGQNFVITRNGSAGNISVPIADFNVSGDSSDTTDFNLTVGGETNINTINFSSNVTVTASATGVVDVTVPEPPRFSTRKDGATTNGDTTILNFVGDNITTTNRGNGQVDISVTASEGGTDTTTDTSNDMTAISNVYTQGDLNTFSDVPAGTARQSFSLTGSTNGGSRHRVIFKNNGTSTRFLQWRTSGTLGTDPSTNINAMSLDGNRVWGLWAPQRDSMQLVVEGANNQGSSWPASTNQSMQANDVFKFDIDLPPNGNIIFSTNSGDILWWHTTLTVDNDALVEVEIPPMTPKAEPSDAPSTFGGTVDPGWTGIFNSPGTEPNTNGVSSTPTQSLTWSADTSAAYARVPYDTIVGGDGDSSSFSTNGNARWGTNPNREPAGIWMEAQGTIDSHARIFGATILLPHSGDDEALTYLREHATDQASWNSHPIYSYNSKAQLTRRSDGLLTGGGVGTNFSNVAGYRVGNNHAGGVNRGPFSDQFMVSFASKNFPYWGLPWDTTEPVNATGTTNGTSTFGNAHLLDQVNTIAFNVPGDPDNAVIQIRRRGTFNTDSANDGRLTAYSFTTGKNANEFQFAFPANQFATTGPYSSALRNQWANFVAQVRSYAGTQIITPSGVTLANDVIERVTLINGNSNQAANYGNIGPDNGAFYARFRFENPSASGTNPQADADFVGTIPNAPATTGITPPSAVNIGTPGGLRGPFHFRREEPLQVVTDSANPDTQANIWQIEYRLIR